MPLHHAVYHEHHLSRVLILSNGRPHCGNESRHDHCPDGKSGTSVYEGIQRKMKKYRGFLSHDFR